jgi:hypothetical protein
MLTKDRFSPLTLFYFYAEHEIKRGLEEEMRKSKQDADSTRGHVQNTDFTADDIAYVHQGPPQTAHAHGEGHKRDMVHTADDVDFTFEGGEKGEQSAYSARSGDVPLEKRTADDVAYTHQGPVTTSNEPPKSETMHTADDLEYTRGVEMPSVKQTLQASAGPADKLHTADDIAFTRGGQ